MSRREQDGPRDDAEIAAGGPAASARAGLPDPDSVMSEDELVSPKGHRYRVLHTTERDDYDEPDPPLTEERERP
jgi:hypothetical protein